MATTAAGLITRSLQKILVQAAEQPVEASEMTLSINELNDMMFELDANGVSLGYTEILNPSDVVTVPAGAIGGVGSLLAVRMAPYFNSTISSGLAQSAKTGLSALYKLGLTILPSRRPCTLPIGSGNEQEGWANTDRFYPCPDDVILTEDTGNIWLESNTDGE